jgi:hypothetical protein
MRARKIAFIAAALGVVSIVTMGAMSIVPHGSGKHGTVAQASPDPDIELATSMYGVSAVERAYGWGPFHIDDY